MPSEDPTVSPSTAPLNKGRLTWIDILRGIAVVGMIETHTVNVFLQSSYDEATWRGWLSFFNGLLAPTFLWIAGYVQGLSLRKMVQRGDTVLKRQRVNRLLVIAGIGYFLHIPWHLWGEGKFNAESWQIFLQVDILQCLAVSLLLILLLGAVLKERFDWGVCALLFIGVFAAPWAQTWGTGIMPLDAWLNRNTGSLFPLFPWVGFAAAGAFMSRWNISAQTWLPIGLVLIAIGTFFAPAPFFSNHPAFYAERLGWMLILITAVFYGSNLLAPNWLKLAGKESLFIYVIHLLILHALPIKQSTPERLWGRQLDLMTVFLVFIGLLLICLVLAWMYQMLRKIPLVTAAQSVEGERS